MFIASSYMLYSPSPGTGLGGGGHLGATNFPVSAFAAPAPEAESAPAVKTVGFRVADILEQRSTVPKTAACVVVSRLRTPSVASSDTRSLSPASPPPSNQIRPHGDGLCATHTVRPSPPASPPHLKFGMDRILSNDNSRIKDHCPPAQSPPSPYTCCSPATLSTRVHRVPPHPTTRGHLTPMTCDCSHPYCDGQVNVFHPLYTAYPTTLTHHSLGYPTCTLYPSSHLSSDLDPLRSHHGTLQALHHHHHHNGNNNGNNSMNLNNNGHHHHHHSLNSSSGKRKRSWSRAVFSNLQRKGLEKRFQIQKYITKPDRRQLAATLGLTDAQVKVWFQNRRMKWRHSKEAKEELNKQNNNKSDSKNTEVKTNNFKSSEAPTVIHPKSTENDLLSKSNNNNNNNNNNNSNNSKEEVKILQQETTTLTLSNIGAVTKV